MPALAPARSLRPSRPARGAAVAASVAPAAPARAANLWVATTFQTSFGESVAVVTAPSWGADPEAPPARLRWGAGDEWEGDVPLPPAAAASPVEFKLVLVADDGSDRIVAWEGGPNRAARAGARARVAWGEPGGEMVVEEDDAAVAEPSLPATAAAALAVPPAADAVAAAGAPAAEPAPALRSFVESSDEASEEDEAVKAEAVAAVEAAAPAPRPFSRPRLADSPAAHAVLGALGGAVALGAAAAVASALAVDAVDLAVMASVAAVGAAVAGVSNKAEENKTDGEEE